MAVNIHTHTHFSLMDSIAKPKEIVRRVKELGQSAVAITDHGTTSGLMEVYHACEGIKMIFGCEHYYCSDVTIKERGYKHINFWAMNEVGYHNLLRLTSEAHENFYYKPRVDLDLIRKYNEGLLMSSACLGGWLRCDDGVNTFLLERFLEIFGDRLYIELHTYSAQEQKDWNMRLVRIAKEYGIPLVAACDSHYARKEDAKIHKAWLTQGKDREDGYYNTPDFYLHSEQEMLDALEYTGCAKEAVENTDALASRCNVEIRFGEFHYPKFEVQDEEAAVRKIMRENWKQKVPQDRWKEYADRINHEEMPVLKDAKYLQYFLITHDFVSHCRKQGIPMGFSRGSVGGCETAYVMDLIQTDALKYNLDFARFCHLERVTPADIDIDVSQQRRGEAIEYLKKKYGENRVYKARTYGYMKARGALQRAGATLGYDPQDVTGWSKTVPEFPDDEYKGDEHEKFLIDQAEAPDDLKELAKNFVGILQNFGAHASAILIFPDDPENYTAIERGKECPVCAYEFHTLEALGCLKLDVLGVKTTDVIVNAMALAGVQLDVTNLPLDDKKTFDMLCEGKTAGVFQIEGVGFTRLVKQVRPRCFDELAPLLAVYRPGIIGAGLLDTYINRRRGEEPVEYLLPELEPILKNTVGIIVFQEQIIEIAKKICGYSAGQADMLRRAVGRKKPEEMERIKPDFISKAMACGQTEEDAKKLFELIEYFAQYGFNKCLSGREKIFRAKNSKKSFSISEMYRIKNDKEYAVANNHENLYRKYNRKGYGKALSMFGDKIKTNTILNITYSGRLPVYKVVTSTGRVIRCTANHKFPTPNGVKLLSDLHIGDCLYCKGEYKGTEKSYTFGTNGSNNLPQKGQCGFRKNPSGNCVLFKAKRSNMQNQKESCQKCNCIFDKRRNFELHHIDGDRSNNSEENLVWLCNSCHKKSHYEMGRTKQYEKGLPVITEIITNIEYECIEDCFDVEMDDPAHNFVVESGIVVCNSHAYGYCMLSYATAYLKAHYPLEFMCALINSENTQQKILPYIEECKRMHIQVLPPDVSARNREWAIENGGLRMGLTYVKGVGGNLRLAESFEAFCEANDKGIVTALIKAGALDCYGNRIDLLKAAMVGADKKDLLRKQEADKERLGELGVELVKIKPELKKYADTKRMIANRKASIKKREKKIEEIEKIERQLEKGDHAIGEMEVLGMSFRALPIVQRGVVKSLRTGKDKKGNDMAWLVLLNEYGEQRCVCFASNWRSWKRWIKEGCRMEFVLEKGVLREAELRNE